MLQLLRNYYKLMADKVRNEFEALEYIVQVILKMIITCNSGTILA